MFQNDHIVMSVNAWNNAPDKFITTDALNREQPQTFASVIQLEVVENVTDVLLLIQRHCRFIIP